MLRQVARRVSDGAILALVKAWLRAPILEEEPGGKRRLKVNPGGSPQGGVISPLLANIYMHPLDQAVNDGCRQKPRMIRYADDLVILCRPGEGKGFKERLNRWLQASGLALNEEKSRVLESRETGFEFLGFSLRWQQSKQKTPYVHTQPSSGAEQALRDKVRGLTRRSTTWRTSAEVVREMNLLTRGWSHYFAWAHSHQSFRAMNHFVGHRMRQWLWRKHGNVSGKYRRWPCQILYENYGLHQLKIKPA